MSRMVPRESLGMQSGGMVSTQDAAMQLMLFFCAELLYNGLRAQEKVHRGLRKPLVEAGADGHRVGNSAHSMHRTDVFVQSTTGGRSIHDSETGEHAGDEHTKTHDDDSGQDRLLPWTPVFSRMQSATDGSDQHWRGSHVSGPALAGWLGIVALGTCLVLEVLIRKQDRLIRLQQVDAQGTRVLIDDGGAHVQQYDGEDLYTGPTPVLTAPAPPARLLMRAVISGGLAV